MNIRTVERVCLLVRRAHATQASFELLCSWRSSWTPDHPSSSSGKTMHAHHSCLKQLLLFSKYQHCSQVLWSLPSNFPKSLPLGSQTTRTDFLKPLLEAPRILWICGFVNFLQFVKRLSTMSSKILKLFFLVITYNQHSHYFGKQEMWVGICLNCCFKDSHVYHLTSMMPWLTYYGSGKVATALLMLIDKWPSPWPCPRLQESHELWKCSNKNGICFDHENSVSLPYELPLRSHLWALLHSYWHLPVSAKFSWNSTDMKSRGWLLSSNSSQTKKQEVCKLWTTFHFLIISKQEWVQGAQQLAFPQ